jgi:hypothetical protein
LVLDFLLAEDNGVSEKNNVDFFADLAYAIAEV